MSTPFRSLDPSALQGLLRVIGGHARVLGRSISPGLPLDGAANKVSDLYAELDEVLGPAERQKGVACKKGCHWCCYRVAGATLPELALVIRHIQRTFPPDRIAALIEKCNEYDAKMAPFRDGFINWARVPCPLLADDGSCSVHEVRPLTCRRPTSNNAEDCRVWAEHPGAGHVLALVAVVTSATNAAIEGLAAGLDDARVPKTMFDLGQVLRLLLDDASLFEKALKNADELPIPRAPSHLKMMPPKRGETAGAVLDMDAGTREALSLIEQSRPELAFAKLSSDRPLHRIMRLALPDVYESHEDLLRWRVRYLRTVDEIVEAAMPPSDVYDAFAHVTTFNLAYQGLSVRAPLAKLGTYFHQEVTGKLFPDLVQPIEAKAPKNRLRLGYVSGNMKFSNGAQWALGWLSNHAEDIETFAFNIGSAEDAVSLLFKQNADHYYHLLGSTAEIGRFIRSCDLDAVIITDIGMAGRNYQLGSMRLAPAQCTAWGHPVTSGLPSIDYYLSSDLMEPDGAEEEYTEQLVRLPRTGLCYTEFAVPVSNKPVSEMGVAESPFTFMGQNPMKWLPQRDELLRRIADKTGRPIYVLSWTGAGIVETLKARFAKTGANVRIVPQMISRDYNKVLSCAEASIDPPDWSGGNTTISALSYGTPVVTLPGPYMRGRHSLAFLRAANAEGLVAEDEDDYIDLATNAERRREAMNNLNRDALFNDVGVVHALDEFLRRATGRA